MKKIVAVMVAILMSTVAYAQTGAGEAPAKAEGPGLKADIKSGAKKVGNGIASGARTVKDKVKKGAKYVGRQAKRGAKATKETAVEVKDAVKNKVASPSRPAPVRDAATADVKP